MSTHQENSTSVTMLMRNGLGMPDALDEVEEEVEKNSPMLEDPEQMGEWVD